jgi:hypothetical protein
MSMPCLDPGSCPGHAVFSSSRPLWARLAPVVHDLHGQSGRIPFGILGERPERPPPKLPGDGRCEGIKDIVPSNFLPCERVQDGGADGLAARVTQFEQLEPFVEAILRPLVVVHGLAAIQGPEQNFRVDFPDHIPRPRMRLEQVIHLLDFPRDSPTLPAQAPPGVALVDPACVTIPICAQRGTAGGREHARASRRTEGSSGFAITQPFLASRISQADWDVNEDRVSLLPPAPDPTEVPFDANVPLT